MGGGANPAVERTGASAGWLFRCPVPPPGDPWFPRPGEDRGGPIRHDDPVASPANPALRLLGPSPARSAAYLLLGLVPGLGWFALIGGLYVAGFFGELALISLPNLVWAQLLLRPIGRLERRLAYSLLGADVPAPAPIRYERSTGSVWSGPVNVVRRTLAAFQDGHSWRVLGWILVRAITGPLGFLLVVLPAALLLAPVLAAFDLAGGLRYWLRLGPLGLVLLPVMGAAMGGFAELHRRLATRLLGPSRADIAAAALARAAQAEEQVRIDQELHDSIGHMLSMIVVQAGAGAHVFDKDPEFARRALGTIEQRGRAALGELDRIIAGIRGGDVPLTRAGTGHGPLPDERDLPALVAGAREAGMDVVARISVGELSSAVGRGVYRIVQEALTNAAKHAPGRTVRIDVATGQEAVAVYVANDFAGAWPVPGRATGWGLACIRNRAVLLGGRASVGPTDHGEFAVSVALPLGAPLTDDPAQDCTLTRHCRCLACDVRRTVLA